MRFSPESTRLGRLAAAAMLAIGCIWAINSIALAQTGSEQAASANAEAAAAAPAVPAVVAETEGSIPTKNLLAAIRDGGLLMYPIALSSFILFVFVFERAISLRHGRVIPRPFVKRFLEQVREKQLDRETALELCLENNSPVAEVFAGAVKKWGRPAVEVEQAVIDAGERVTNSLRRYLRLFNGIATITPLLGLLGTVVGMIQAFNVIAAADARPELLAGGISTALLTTAGGLTVAIPALIAYMFFVGRVDRLIIEIDALGQKLVSSIACDAWDPESERESNKQKAAARAKKKVA